jgi:hypothetical protein
MNTQTIRSAGSLQDALYALALAKPAPDAAVLDDLVRRYPQHAAQLTDMAVALALDVLADRDDEPINKDVTGASPAVARAMSRFHNRLFTERNSLQAADTNPTPAEGANPFSSLARADLRDFGSRLRSNTVFAMKLRDRLIDPDTMTDGFRRHVADTMRAPLEVVVAHLAGRSEMAAQTRYKAEQKPVVGRKQSFEEAVRSSGLSPEQQAFLLSL